MQLVASIAGLYVIIMVTIIIHELGHFVAAKIVGLHPTAVIIGYTFRKKINNIVHMWPIIGIRSSNGVSVGFSPIPLRGETLFSTPLKDMLTNHRWKTAFMVSGGILMQIICIALVFIATGIAADGFQFSDLYEGVYKLVRAILLLPAVVFDMIWMMVTKQPGLIFKVSPISSSAALSYWEKMFSLYLFVNIAMIYWNILPFNRLDGYYLLKALLNKPVPEE